MGPAMKLKCGYRLKAWHQAKQEAKAVLIGQTKARAVSSYFELAVLLRETGAEENAAGRGMLTALVVARPGQKQPDLEFFELATQLRKNTSNIMWCWLKGLEWVFRYWSKARRKQTPYRRGPKRL
jgi:hypothetical protein